MLAYHLADDHKDIELERRLLAAIAVAPSIYWTVRGILADDAFACERSAWRTLEDAVRDQQVFAGIVPGAWSASSDPLEDARRLAELARRRAVAEMQERIAFGLRDPKYTADDVVAIAEEAIAQLHGARQTDTGCDLLLADDLATAVLSDAAARARHYQETGHPVVGLPTGLPGLDEVLCGMRDAVYLLGGGPGIGKTTLALQIAAATSRVSPALYVTFENSPANLVEKLLCAQASLDTRSLQRGTADLAKLEAAAEGWRSLGTRLAFVEGTSRLTVDHIRGFCLRIMDRYKQDRCLIVIDYLQLWSKVSEAYRALPTIRERVEALGADLRELVSRLKCPVLALVSLNRANGDYGAKKGTPSLDALKESGDLEYSADAVLLLHRGDHARVNPPSVSVDLSVAKNRFGQADRTIQLVFRPDVATIREWAAR